MKKQQPGNKFINFVSALTAILYVIMLVYIFFLARRRWIPFPKRNFNLIPFREKVLYLQAYSIHRTPENLEFYKDLVGNVILFVPFPLLLFYFAGIKSHGRLLLIAACTSFFIEVIQYVFNIGVADIDDLILNTTGSAIGLLVLCLLSRLEINPGRQLKWRTEKAIMRFPE